MKKNELRYKAKACYISNVNEKWEREVIWYIQYST